jgi:deoxyribodipyrimidine photo-lyase
MNAFRRTGWNFSLQRARDWSLELGKPLIVLEALRCGYEWSSDRFHLFIMEGMAHNWSTFQKKNLLYYPFLETKMDEGKGLVQALAKRACVVVTDDYPDFFLPRAVSSASRQVSVLMEKVDSNGLLPMRAADRVYPTAYAFRRFLQKRLPEYLIELPDKDPLKSIKAPKSPAIPEKIRKRWPPSSLEFLESGKKILASLPLDHEVGPVETCGGGKEAQSVLREFLENRLDLYDERRNQPEEEVTSGLSPYLHFGHISAHQIFKELMSREDWFLDRLSPGAKGSRSGWWGVGESAEAFLDELITWREVGFNMCWQKPDYDRYESLPEWALATLYYHEMDEREYVYTSDEFERATTHDPLWNAAQIQLVREGRIHNYLRMLWGKKILQWSPKPKEALEIMIHLNNKFALDGRDPNSYSGIFWVLGRYDRAWGPERPIFGKVRFMSSKNTARKVRVKNYIEKYSQ